MIDFIYSRKAYLLIMDILDDLYLAEIVRERASEEEIPVNIEDL